MIRTLFPAHINIFAQFNIALRAQNCQPPVAPIGQSIRREPIHTNITRAPVTAQIDLAKILHLRITGVCVIGGERMGHFGRI